jgi:hypothetical protein
LTSNSTAGSNVSSARSTRSLPSGSEAGAARGNGELIEAAQREFDALVTMDRGIPYQQNLTGVDLVILLLEARSNRLADLTPLVEGAEAALSKARPGEVVRVTAP